MLTFYFAPGSSSMAPHIALHETGAPFEARPMSFATHDMRKPEFLAINPNGKVPTLLIDGRALTEVAGILFYLARSHPQANLLPTNDRGSAATTGRSPAAIRSPTSICSASTGASARRSRPGPATSPTSRPTTRA